ncbi:uncharacterized protein LY89DRAFT_595743 [Mollisia scopiformis]|uniref:Uncharacterized protein n=1 Tax=Mollisia scopiformis TaxID=149040 RepID=A0A194WSQ3_MOLSC|nr:uncharacterized protein LY89DRAFT_595743 [Mollisia scopiformis]KUJ10988.1 hypothetical protein LY89DRAFT_595743 [Mollisia scopiformis]
MLPTILLAFAATQVLADGAAIVSAIDTISSATTTLNDTVTAFPSNPLLALGDVLPLLTDSTALLNDINSATNTAKSSANLSTAEAFNVAVATLSLQSTVESVLDNIVSAKSRFDKLLIVSPVVLLNLKLEKQATDNFAAAVVSKVPAALQSTAESLITPIDNAFTAAISDYE